MTASAQFDPGFQAGEKILGDRYVVVHKNGRPFPAGPVETVDRGGAGTVYRVLYQGVQDRALKLLTATSRRRDPQKRTSAYQATFDREQQILLRLSHGNIVRLYEIGELLHDGKRWPYHVTEYVDGPTLLDEMRSAETNPRHCYALLAQVVRAVRYMHELGVAHGDIKYENIRSRHLSDRTRQAVLLDFGSAQLFGDKAKQEVNILRDVASKSTTGASVEAEQPLQATNFVTTERLLDSATRRYKDKPVTPANRDVIFPHHDIRAIGVLLDDLLEEPPIRTKFENELGANGMLGMELVRERLLRKPQSRYYHTISHVCDDLEKLRSNYLSPAGIAELSVAAEFKYSIATPGGRVVITPKLNHLVSHKLFQRIGNIPQLEMLRLKFTGATHTRAQHSALVLHNTRYYLSHLLNGPVFRLLTRAYELEATLILALLHDIGHYQLSHLFEDYASEQRRLKSNQVMWDDLEAPASKWREISFDIPNDDDLFVAVFDHLSPEGLEGSYGEVIAQAEEDSARRLKVDKQDTLGRLTKRHFGAEAYNSVIEIHESIYRRKKQPSPSHIVLGGVLSSPLDADKVSYLRQDSEETGVRFGSGIDFDGLLGALRSPSPEDIRRANEPVLAITTKGIAAAESVLFARKVMYERVYWHPTNRAIMAMAKYCITRLLREGALNMPEFLRESFFMSHTEALGCLHRRFDNTFKNYGTNPIAYVLEGERAIYRPVVEFSKQTGNDDRRVWQYLLGCTVFDVAALEDDLTTSLWTDFPRLNITPGDVVLDVPAKDRGTAAGERGGSIYVYEGNSYGRGKLLDTVTPMGKVLVATHESRSKICRILLSRRLRKNAEGTGKLEELSKNAREVLRLKAGVN